MKRNTRRRLHGNSLTPVGIHVATKQHYQQRWRLQRGGCASALQCLHLTTAVLHAAPLQLFISVISGSLFTVKLGPKKLKIFMPPRPATNSIDLNNRPTAQAARSLR